MKDKDGTRKENQVSATITDAPSTITGTVTLNAIALDHLLGGAALAAHKQEDLPGLNGIRIELSPGKVRAVATDRYRLFMGDYESETITDSAALMISLKDAEKVRKFLAPIVKNRIIVKDVTVTFDTVSDTLSLSHFTGSMSTRLDSYRTFPQYEHLFPTEFAGVDAISLSPKFLADFAKIPGLDKDTLIKFRINAANRPVMATINTDLVAWHLLLMPMREETVNEG